MNGQVSKRWVPAHSRIWERIVEASKAISAIAGIVAASVIVANPYNADARIIRAMSDAYLIGLKAALGDDVAKPVELSEGELNARRVAELEHEMMIEGHESDCPICIEKNREKSAIEKWAGKDWARWRR